MIKYSVFGLAFLLVIGSCGAAVANNVASEGVAAGASNSSGQLANVFYNVPGADQIGSMNAPEGGDTYLFLAGSAFNPRTSSQTVTYPGAGCSYSSGALTTSLEVPQGADIYGVRIFYYSTVAADHVSLFLTRYLGDGGLADLVSGSSTFSVGYGSDYFTPSTPPLIIDNFANAYVLTATMALGTRFCGMRVFYNP